MTQSSAKHDDAGSGGVEARACVRAVFKGELVYLSTEVQWPSMHSLITCSMRPQYMSESAADRLAERAERAQVDAEPFDRLTAIRVEQVTDQL